MALLECGKCGLIVDAEELAPDPDWVCASCQQGRDPISTRFIPPIMTPPAMTMRDNRAPCPQCGYGLLYRKSDEGRQIKCPACKTRLVFGDGGVPLLDLSPEPAAEDAVEEEKTSGGLIFSFVAFPFASVYALTWWKDVWPSIDSALRPALKALGLI